MDMLIRKLSSAVISAVNGKLSSAVNGKLSSAVKLTFNKQAVISCHMRERGSNRKKVSFDHGQTDRQNTSAGVELRFAAKKI